MSFIVNIKQLIAKASKSGMEIKYVVMKVEDINEALHEHEIDNLVDMMDAVTRYRERQGKPVNEYVVINTDEPYFPEIKEIMERNGHWG